MPVNKFLVIGGTGKTGSRVVRRLREAGQDVVVASREAKGEGAVKFDWADPKSFTAAISDVRAVYLIAPLGVMEPAPVMQAFVEQAVQSGVKRFVLLSASSLPEDGPAMGAVHGYLHRNAPEWAVLQPSWFMQNFSEGPHQPAIRDGGVIFSATGSGSVGFIDAEDIARVAVKALTDEMPHNCAHLITGPEALTYNQVAEILSKACGHTVKHFNVSVSELTDRLVLFGVPHDFAAMLAAMDGEISRGSENLVTSAVQDVTGQKPANFEDFAQRSAAAWMNSGSKPA